LRIEDAAEPSNFGGNLGLGDDCLGNWHCDLDLGQDYDSERFIKSRQIGAILSPCNFDTSG
jgi:hypothetical protein